MNPAAAGSPPAEAAGDPARLAGLFVDVPGGRLWAEHAGSGPAVLFAHAAIADRRMWDEQMAALSGRYHVIRYDQRGFGRSSPPEVPYSPVADLGAVLDHAGAGRAALVGCSLAPVGTDTRLLRSDQVGPPDAGRNRGRQAARAAAHQPGGR